MSCQTPPVTLDLLAFDFLEGRERKRVEEHAEICPDCRAALEACRADRAMVTRALAVEERTMPAPRRLPWIAAAAAAVLLVAIGPWLLDPRSEVPPTGIADTEPDVGEPGFEIPPVVPTEDVRALPASLAAIVRQERLDPERFTAALRRNWPDAAPADLAAAETAAWRAVDRYRRRIRNAKTPVEKASAERQLTEALAKRVAQLIVVYGEPAPVEEPPGGPGEEEKDQVVVAPGRPDLLIRGTPEEVAAQAAVMIANRLGVASDEAFSVSRRWVTAYRSVLDQTPPEVVADFEAGLLGESAGDPAVERLREGLLAVQMKVESAMPGATSAPTFFLFATPPVSDTRELDAVDRAADGVDQQDAGDVEQNRVLEELTASRPVRDGR
jgi:hypothetical protein